MYNHQGKYAKAIGNLYRNRGQVQEKSPVDIKGIANTLGGNLVPLTTSKPVGNTMADSIRQAQMAQAIQHQTMRRDMGELGGGFQLAEEQPMDFDQWQGRQFENGLVQENQEEMDNLEEFKAMAKEQQQRNRMAEAANLAPFNGKFSHTGYKDHVKQSQLQAQDIQTSKQLMNGGMNLDAFMYSGMGGTRPRSPEEL